MKRVFKILLLVALFLQTVKADVLTEAQALADSGDYAAAADLLRQEMSAVKSRQFGAANQLLGECEFELGNRSEARKCFEIAKSKGVAAASLYLGRLDYVDYDFESSAEHYASYAALMKKAKKSISEEVEAEHNLVRMAGSFLERVEKIPVIDSIDMTKDDFFRAYLLPISAGRLLSAKDVFGEDSEAESPVFTTENGDRRYWAQPDTIGIYHILESLMLTDGTWSRPAVVGDSILAGADALYPFMMADGVTFYFASDADDSLGGLDIYRANRDAVTGAFMEPQNMGMPYNSPADDYMLAIDEFNGIGWWATERNSSPGNVTIYVFVAQDMRKNYDPATEDVVSFARLDNYRDTWGDNDYTELLEKISYINPDETKKKVDFHFPIVGGEYTTLDDFSTPDARSKMESYLARKKVLDELEKKLVDLRLSYHNGEHDVASEIVSLEKEAEQMRASLKKLRSDVYRAERR